MKKNTVLFTRILYILFIIGTIISLFIAFKDINNIIALNFVKGYVIFTFFMFIYIPLITVINLKKLKWIKVKKRLLKLIILFVLFGASNYIFDYAFRPSKIDLFRESSIAFGLSFGITFVDITFLKKKYN
ncbi:hypothetical protein ACFIJ5_14075 [Haloimpatiens sp. FM7330]|uniref:hypothetical protein n=1 Tax=Haloimpatiens sp. FM7330 TaxID=3298610 RepID=UPI00362646F6